MAEEESAPLGLLFQTSTPLGCKTNTGVLFSCSHVLVSTGRQSVQSARYAPWRLCFRAHGLRDVCVAVARGAATLTSDVRRDANIQTAMHAEHN